ncbi:MAG: hypothetical protein H0W30_01145 [Gemmatimonadaceae bacterium]|nr:hypothetical protein [Gemmatimonadaceae bacterium]
MRRIGQLGVPFVALYGLACGGGGRVADAELSKDLALAAAERLVLASEHTAGVAQVVSSIELGATGGPARAKVPTRRVRARAVVSPQTDVEVTEPSPSVIPVAVTTTAEELAVAVDSRPSPRPHSMPVVYPGGNQSGADEQRGEGGDDAGGGIGVVIRGGGVGRDKCARHVFVNDRFPTTFPRSGGTFPR